MEIPEDKCDPKVASFFVNLLKFLERIHVFGDLGEDAGERAHQ